MRSMREFYQAKYRGSLFVVKIGGRAVDDPKSRRSILSNIKELTADGIKVLLIYGGGKAIDDGLAEAGIEPRKVDGRRITGKREIEVVKQVMAAKLGTQLASTMKELGMNGFCLNSIPANWIDIKPRPRENPDDFGYDGTITKTYETHVRDAFDSVSFIATPCIGISDHNAVNINADNVAVALAAGCHTRKLIFMSDVDGVHGRDGTALPYLTDQEIPGLIEDGTVHGGMRVKLENCLYALENGVKRIHLLDGFRQDALLNEVYDSEGPATMVIREEGRQAYLNEVQAEKAIAAQY